MHDKQTTIAAARVRFVKDDYVLYRDPALFWAGQPGHTFVCRITRAWANNTFDLAGLNGRLIQEAKPDYMRLLPPADAMRDIDTAPLHSEGAADDMTAAAMAWLTQRAETANRRPELPAHD